MAAKKNRNNVKESLDISEVIGLPLELNSQKNARQDNLISVSQGHLKLYDESQDNSALFKELVEMLAVKGACVGA